MHSRRVNMACFAAGCLLISQKPRYSGVMQHQTPEPNTTPLQSNHKTARLPMRHVISSFRLEKNAEVSASSFLSSESRTQVWAPRHSQVGQREGLPVGPHDLPRGGGGGARRGAPVGATERLPVGQLDDSRGGSGGPPRALAVGAGERLSVGRCGTYVIVAEDGVEARYPLGSSRPYA